MRGCRAGCSAQRLHHPPLRRVEGSGCAGAPARDPRRLEPAALGELLAAARSAPQCIAPRNEGAVGELLERSRARKQEPLAGDTPEREQRSDLRLELNALGDSLESECLAESDDRARELRTVVGVGQAADEGAVDLQDVDGEAVQ